MPGPPCRHDGRIRSAVSEFADVPTISRAALFGQRIIGSVTQVNRYHPRGKNRPSYPQQVRDHRKHDVLLVRPRYQDPNSHII